MAKYVTDDADEELMMSAKVAEYGNPDIQLGHIASCTWVDSEKGKHPGINIFVTPFQILKKVHQKIPGSNSIIWKLSFQSYSLYVSARVIAIFSML